MSGTSGSRFSLWKRVTVVGSVGLTCARSLGADSSGLPAAPSPTADWLKQIPAAQFQPSNEGFVLQYYDDPVFRGRQNMQARQRVQDREPSSIETGDTIETGRMGRALLLRFSQAAALDENSKIAIETPQELRALQGQMYVKTFGLNPAHPLWVLAAGGRARLATEFHLAIDPATGTATLTLFSGELALPNAPQPVLLSNRADRATITTNGLVRHQVRAGRNELNNLIQWILHYPAVLDLDELQPLGGLNSLAAVESAAAYRRGNLPLAINLYIKNRPGSGLVDNRSNAERLYEGALLVAAGQIDQAQQVLAALPNPNADPLAAERQQRLTDALLEVVAAVKFQSPSSTRVPHLASEWMARSYTDQSLSKLEMARAAARRAAALGDNFGFAQARLAEMEFSFGENRAASKGLDRALDLSPDNAQAHVLRGFIFAAEGQRRAAMEAFTKAVDLDGRLGDAWLGVGLAEFRWGDPNAALRYFETAVAQEPQRAVLRSYLGKAYQTAGYFKEAAKELALAKEMDRNDPTPYLYSAILKQQRNQINGAIEDLERSRGLSDNRSLFRSRLLLDQDLAIRNANLAAIYQDAGMEDVSVREATKALANDYANYSAHLFLANSYNALRDLALVNLRYESATFSEYLLANLLSPVGGTALSPTVSQQEYSRLFERDHIGFTSVTGYRSDGLLSQSAVQYGVIDNTEYAIEGDYRIVPNQGRGANLEQFLGSIQAKQQLSREDSVYIQAIYNNVQGGDLRQIYDPRLLDSDLRTRDIQSPNVFLGYHHEWSPGIHTLVLLANSSDRFTLQDSRTAGYWFETGSESLGVTPFAWQYENEFTLWNAEAQQIWQTDNHILVGGARFQTAQIDTRSRQVHQVNFPPIFDNPAADQVTDTELQRFNLYTYYQQRIGTDLIAIGGISFDTVRYPANVLNAPISNAQRSSTEVSPKVGLIWTPHPAVLARAAYSRSLGGFSFDTSVRLEPAQLAGFNQAFRSLAPESLVGAIPAARFEALDLAMDYHLRSRTYFGWQLEWLRSDPEPDVGAFEAPPDTFEASLTQVRQKVNYDEKSLTLYVNQLIGNNWSVGSRYRLTDSRLNQEFRDFSNNSLDQALLHELDAFILFNHPSGFFSILQATFLAQNTEHSAVDLSPERVWQLDAYAGYRFPRRHAELLIGVANITDQDYRLNPVTVYPALPRDRSLVARLRIDF